MQKIFAVELLSLHHSILDLYAVQLLQHGLRPKPEKKQSGSRLDTVEGESGDVLGQQDLFIELSHPGEGGCRIHNSAVDQYGGQCAKHA